MRFFFNRFGKDSQFQTIYNSSFIIYNSPLNYVYCANNPVMLVDPDGRDFALGINYDNVMYGHITLYFQNPNDNNNWYSYDQFATKIPTICGKEFDCGFMSGASTNAGVEINKVDTIPTKNIILFKTSVFQDKSITLAAFDSQKKHNNGELKYNIYSNSCLDAAVDVVNNAQTSYKIPNDALTLKPSTFFKNLFIHFKEKNMLRSMNDQEKKTE